MTAVVSKAAVLLAGLGAWVAVSCAQPLPFDPTPVKDAIQDGRGRIWAIDGATGLNRWTGRGWQPRPVSLPELAPTDPTDPNRPPEAYPLLLRTNLQGVVHVCWAERGSPDSAESRFWITRIDDTDSPSSSAFHAQLASAFLAFGSDGIGWLTEAGPRIYRVGADLDVQLACTIPSNRLAGTRFDQFNPVQAVPIDGGRMLFWGERRFRELATLRTPWVASDSGVEELPAIEGLPEGGFSFLAPVGPGLLWAGIPSWDDAAGLYQVDLNNRRGTRLPEPSPAAFAHVRGIDTSGMDRYVVSEDRGARTTLWRWRNASWEQVASPLDSEPFDDYYRVTRPLFPDARGLWVGTGGNGLLWLPSSADPAPASFDWRRGQPLESVHRIASLPAGGMLLVGLGQGTTPVRADDLFAGRTVSPRILDLWKGDGNLQFDPRGRLWTLRDAPPEGIALADWDGVKWTRHDLPSEIRIGDLGFVIGIDTFGRLWVPYRDRAWIPARKELKLTNKVAVFEPRTSRWRPFDSLESALVDLIRTDARARVNLPGSHQPEFDAGGRICFLGTDWARGDQSVHYFDGEGWRRWDLASVGFVRPGSIGQPYFDAEGALAINFGANRGGATTARFDGRQWNSAPFRSAGPRDPFNTGRPSGTRLPRRSDRNDAEPGPWRTQDQQLLRSQAGIDIPQFRLTEVHPFIGARRVDQVWTDARGNLVLSTRLPAGNLSGRRQYVVLAPVDAETPTRMNLVRVDTAEAELRLTETGVAGSMPDREGFRAVEIHDDRMTVHWSGEGILEVADRVEGPWTAVSPAASPHTVIMSMPSRFYRIRR